MLNRYQVDKVQRLLEQEHSQRAVARMTGISRGTVGTIANGRHAPKLKLLRDIQDEEAAEYCGPKIFCRTCGYMIYEPCGVCRAREYKRDHPQTADVDEQPPPPLGLELRPQHQRRYEKVRARRIKAGCLSSPVMSTVRTVRTVRMPRVVSTQYLTMKKEEDDRARQR